METQTTPSGTLSRQVLRDMFAAHDKTRDPVNALVVWTEIGRALSGTLEKRGASPGLLRRIIVDYARREAAGREFALERWIYRVPPEERLDKEELAQLTSDAATALAAVTPAAFERSGEADLRALFLEAVHGWFPLGLELVRALPAGAGADRSALVGALGAWCARYLPDDPAGPRDLGIRVEKRR
ncbi:MAG TPA: hypothetical protein VKZ18_25110 [Polyangia bacterium]|nr:hypothetical protein [Polyangia bacterium]